MGFVWAEAAGMEVENPNPRNPMISKMIIRGVIFIPLLYDFDANFDGLVKSQDAKRCPKDL